MKKYYKIAGLTVTMDSFGKTEEQAKAYLCQECPKVDIEVVSPWKEIKADYPQFSDDIGEYLATGSYFYKNLLNFDGFMLHSSAVVVDGKAYLFTADCGTGKSTHTKLWLQLFGDKAFVLNDDKPALRLEEDGWYAYGTPWSGKHDISVDKRIPLAGIAIVERAAENKIVPLSSAEGIPQIMKQVNRPKAMEYRIKLLELLDKLLNQIPVWRLQCNMEIDAAIVSYEAMSGQEWEKKNEA